MIKCFIKWITLVSFASCAGGCFSIRMGDARSHTSVHSGYIQCQAISIDGIIPEIVYPNDGSILCSLELHATGDFVVHDVIKVITKKGLVPRLYCGFLPGIHKEGIYDSKAEENEDRGTCALVALSYYLYVPVAITAIYATFFEPFRDYHTYCGVATCAVFGFSKRLIDEGDVTEEITFRETGSSQRSTTAKLYGYKLEIEGREYDGSSGAIKIGLYDFGQCLQRGRRLRAKFITAPSVRPDSSEFLHDLTGFEFEIVCP